MTSSDLNADSLLTSHQAGSILQVNPSSINKWVKEGRIPAFRTPGGHRRIRAGDLVQFLNAHQMPVPRQLAPAARRRVLIVDDDPKVLTAFERMLKPMGQRVELLTADNGIDALVKVGAFRPHVVLLDIYMPQLDGIEVCRRLRQMPDTGAIEVVMTSGQISPDIEKKATEAGCRRCVAKPIKLDTLLGLVGLEAGLGAQA